MKNENNNLPEQKENGLNGDLEEMRDILASAGLGTWHIELRDGEAPRMRADEKMLSLLGIDAHDLSPRRSSTPGIPILCRLPCPRCCSPSKT